ncbi:MAG: uracil-DNA glycosylase [Epsilonproteobacteria bacterium]|nr:uracil-DNA glycosylase [Campylobacterota bacterium]
MQDIDRLKLLKELYTYKSIGYDYIEDIKLADNKRQFSSHPLPDDLTALEQIVKNCHLCQLSKTRKNVVFGEGDPNAKLMFIGEGPGANEDSTGKPFVGRAGELLTKIIENVLLLKREDVFIANIVKCRPPGNRVPTDIEVKECIPYLLKQIELIKPSVIVTLGATAYKNLTLDTTSVSKIRGEILDYNGIKLIPTFHPSYLLRNPSAKKFVYFDMKKVKILLENLI